MSGSGEQHDFDPLQLVGQRLHGISRVYYQHTGTIDRTDGPLELELKDVTFLLEPAVDGERLRVRRERWTDAFAPPLSKENQQYINEHGKWVRVDCSNEPNYADMLKGDIMDARLLHNSFGHIAGLRLSVKGRDLWFVVHGDEAHVHWSRPDGFTVAHG